MHQGSYSEGVLKNIVPPTLPRWTNCDSEAVARQEENWKAAIWSLYISSLSKELSDQKRYFQWSWKFIKIGRSTKINLLGNLFPGGSASLGAFVRIRKHVFPDFSRHASGMPGWHIPTPCSPTPLSVSSVDGIIHLYEDRTSSCYMRCPGIKMGQEREEGSGSMESLDRPLGFISYWMFLQWQSKDI